ncbi:MAG TPA: AraC family transcriptional regulator [Lysobacter sp.]|nr:AraC family transcriptional regulator [Lysobacter sp.]
MTVDRLATLLQHFSVSARMFHSGPLCGINDFAPEQGLGQLHLVQQGPLRIEHLQQAAIDVARPSLLFYPRPMHHRFISDAREGATMACAHLQFGDGGDNPLVQSLPAFVVMPLDELDGLQPVLDLLFREAFGAHCGRQVVVDRLFEVVLVHIIRRLMQQGAVEEGLLAGMAHPQLARSLVALHAQPALAWSVETLAREAGMSRSVYAASFRRVLGTTPADYLAAWRLSLTQQQLRQGKPLKQISDSVGYGSVATLSRAFKARWGMSPREWKQAGSGGASGGTANEVAGSP